MYEEPLLLTQRTRQTFVEYLNIEQYQQQQKHQQPQNIYKIITVNLYRMSFERSGNAFEAPHLICCVAADGWCVRHRRVAEVKCELKALFWRKNKVA